MPNAARPSTASAAPAGAASAPATSWWCWPPRRAPTASCARSRTGPRPGPPPGVDAVVAVTHTEGGGSARPNNLDHVLRVLAGFMVHPNVGAVLAADDGTGAYGNDDLRRFMERRGDPLDRVPHGFFRIERGYEAEVAGAAALVEGWLPAAALVSPCSAMERRRAQACGRSRAVPLRAGRRGGTAWPRRRSVRPPAPRPGSRSRSRPAGSSWPAGR